MLQLPKRRSRQIALLGLAGFFVAAGANHLVNPEFYIKIMPSYLPAPLEFVYLSGFFEILGGIAVLFSRVRVLAGWSLILLLLAVFPANLHMAIHPELFPEFSPFQLHVRLPFQFLFIVWAYWATRPEGPPDDVAKAKS